MTFIRKTINSLTVDKLVSVVCLTLLVTLVGLTPVRAQDLDLQPPVMELEEIDRGIAGETQVFTVTVTDEKALTTVVLFHRFSGDDRYASTEMLPIARTDIFTASVSTDADDPRDIEYYIQAEDTGGNKAIKGFAFDPLVRDITGDAVITAASTSPGGMSRNRKIMWTVLGVLAIGVIASQSGGGGGSSSEPASPPVTIVVNPTDP